MVLLLWVHFAIGAERQCDLIKVMGSSAGTMWETTWRVAESKLKAASMWDSEKEPPLSITQAIKAARSHLQSIGRPHTYPVRCMSLQSPMGAKPGSRYYFYFISFDDLGDGDPSPEDVDVLVLLDGSIVSPVRTQ